MSKSKNARANSVPILALVWIGLLVVTAFASLCPRFTAFYAAYLVVDVGLAAGALAFLDAIYRRNKTTLHPAFKKYVGYALVIHYAAAAMPRVDWAGSGLIGQGRVAYLFVLTALCLASGILLFVVSGRPAVYASLGLIEDEEVGDKELRKKRFAERRRKGFFNGVLEWADALGFAAILVILINTFVFQLYEIPSESMVPAFLMKDRPFTAKFEAGPRIPLTDWRLPFLRLPRRGDIITLANPRYPENQSVNLKKYLAQLVSMVTFTAVNIDKYLPDGSQKADPLVKRIVGLPGEKLMMIDDVLYSRRKGETDFSVVEADKNWARPDLWKESPETLARIQERPIDEKHRQVLNDWDAKREAADPAALAASIAATARDLAAARTATRAAAFLGDLEKTMPRAFQAVTADIADLAKAEDSSLNPIAAICTPLLSARGGIADLAIALSESSSPKLRAAVADFAACPAAAIPPANAYERGRRILNLMIKDNFLKRAAREARLIAEGSMLDGLRSDAALAALNKDGSELDYYVNGNYGGLYDERNFPEFPAGDGYLGPEQYFAMGDNRYNSLDFRYRTGNLDIKPLDAADPSSVRYYSNIDPFALDLRYIEGYALFRIWPPSRIGALH